MVAYSLIIGVHAHCGNHHHIIIFKKGVYADKDAVCAVGYFGAADLVKISPISLNLFERMGITI
jgi:hypothetical protein